MAPVWLQGGTLERQGVAFETSEVSLQGFGRPDHNTVSHSLLNAQLGSRVGARRGLTWGPQEKALDLDTKEAGSRPGSAAVP